MSNATTPPTPAAPATIYEREARSRKILRLVMSLDAALSMLGTDPFSPAALEFVLCMTDAAWRCAASHAGVPMPSATTKAEVESVYRRRIEIRACLTRVVRASVG